MTIFNSFPPGSVRRHILFAAACLAIEAVAALYFVTDGIDDVLAQLRRGVDLELIMECIVALALLIAVVGSARQLQCSLADARKQDAALQVARGSMAALLEARFAEWGLSRSEAEVALFTLKGCSIAEIARLRNSAESTVRSQLSQVYAKADVSNQTMLVTHFIEELV